MEPVEWIVLSSTICVVVLVATYIADRLEGR